ncbi:hypothetical protein FKW77_002801 [Venturia effusa]|uniref:Heterokaryon incompatibility domain-containing protein n=1 Tax=Venturia effusa TaxID=50376 RepID=A0A517LL30_9PEZI|nr:hypothetical protein FKW77_002801 [Venturia effusa]
MLCDVCLGIFKINPVRCDEVVREGSYDPACYLLPHHFTFQSLQASAATGCTICRRLSHAAISIGIVACQTEVSLTVFVDHVFHKSHNSYFLTFQFKDRADGECEVGKVTYSLEPCVVEPFVFSVPDNSPPSFTGSGESLHTIKFWIKQCLKNDDYCFEDPSGWSPTRLLDVRHETLRLTTSGHSNRRYTTLSHCWGNAQLLKLTKENFDAFQQGLPIASLPKTFQDAIAVTRSLGIDFIWIDSLCIIQNSKEDWQMESAQMGQVYRFSSCNIAATDAHDASEGLFFDRGFESLETFGVHVRWDIKPDVLHGSFAMCPENLVCSMNDRARDRTSPLNNRGWVLQEQLLAPRTVSFGKRQIMWLCRGFEACEAFPLGIPFKDPRPDFDIGSGDSEHFYHEVKQAIHGHTHDAYQNDVDANLWHMWQMIVREYTTRKLSHSTDKLVALNGLTSLVAKKMGYENHAGILFRKDDMHTLHELMWTPLAKARRMSQNCAPSWSWASVDGAVGMLPYAKNRRAASKIEYMRTETAPGITNGQVTGGTLCITGPLTPGIVFDEDTEPHIDAWDDDEDNKFYGRGNAFVRTELQEDRLRDFMRQIFFLPILDCEFNDIVEEKLEEDRNFLGLVLKLRPDAKFERVAHFCVFGVENGVMTLMEEHGTVQTIEIV